MKTDEELMTAYIQGDIQAFETLYHRYKSRVYGYLNGKVDGTQVDDVFQGVFARLHQKKHLYKDEHSFAPWFFTLIKNFLIDHFRKNKIHYQELTEEPIQPVAKNEDQKEEVASLNITEQEQLLLYKKFVEGNGYKELEEEFQTSASTLRKRVSRLLKSLKKLRGEA